MSWARALRFSPPERKRTGENPLRQAPLSRTLVAKAGCGQAGATSTFRGLWGRKSRLG